MMILKCLCFFLSDVFINLFSYFSLGFFCHQIPANNKIIFLQMMLLMARHKDGKNITKEIAVFLLGCEL